MINCCLNVKTVKIEMFKSIIAHYDSIQPLSSKFKRMICNGLHVLQPEKKTIFRPSAHDLHHAYFIVEGIMRRYVFEGELEITAEIYFPNETLNVSVPDDTSILSGKHYFEMITPAKIIVIPHKILDRLSSECPETDLLIRKILTIKLDKVAYESQIARIPSALQRYRIFLKNNDQRLLGEISSKVIANYLGMREETLSRVKTKLRSK